MAEMIVSGIVNLLIEKLGSIAWSKVTAYGEINSQLNKLKTTLTLIQGMLADAGKKHITQKAVELWLKELQDLAYDIDDVLDDLVTDDMKRTLNQESDVSTSRKRKFFAEIVKDYVTPYTPYNLIYAHKMTGKLDDINNRSKFLVEQKNNLGLDVNVKADRSNITNRRLEQTSLVDELTILGREGDKEELLGKLLGNEACNQNLSVVSIVGLGGIGKTTLAKVVYNDEKVKNHFELRAWVCVSEEFDVYGISKVIYQAVTGEEKGFANLDLLHVNLREKLANKRFLVVLDDVWNEDLNQWKLLKCPFVVGSTGSKIIVTTRKTKVALVMDCLQPYKLEVLSDEIALSLFAYNSLNEKNFFNHPSLKLIAQGIIKKCDGLPLALVTLGKVLKTKGTSDHEWEELLNSEIWNIDDGSDILPALKLSYYDLPLHLKQLFAYCSLFPKDYLFNKDELVLLWMAEGFLLQSKGIKSMESLGHGYFKELQSRSFFQPSADNESGYTMHDLMNELALNVAGEFFFMLDDKSDANGCNESFEKCRHFSFICKRHLVYQNFKELHRARGLRTFLPVIGGWLSSTLDNVLVDLIPQVKFLRVLSLTNHSITHVPRSIGNLKHLRYLNFSRTIITSLPEAVSELINLQSLLVHQCYELKNLPVSFANLINMRHLDMRDTPSLKEMPPGIGRLKSLQTLSKFCIGEHNGFKISELKDLVDLQGELSIKELEKVKDPMQAKEANLQQKKGLVDLDMEWSHKFDDSRNLNTEFEVLKLLRPYHKLKALRISCYGGVQFPSWLGDPFLNQLRKLTLKDCRNCKHLPTVEQLSALEILEVSDMPSLEIMSIGLMPSLWDLYIKGCSKAVFGAIVGVSPSIHRLRLQDIKGITQLHGEVLNNLRYLEIENCDELKYLWADSELEEPDNKGLNQLHVLYVYNCNNLTSFGEKEVNVGISMKSVRKVTLIDCHKLESYNSPNSVESVMIKFCSSLTSLTFSTSSLKFLQIICCKNLTSFPHEHLQSLTSLEELEIRDCESMDNSFPCGLWPPNLRTLKIGCLNKRMSEWGLQNYPTSLVKLFLYGRDSGIISFAMEGDARNTASSSLLLPPSLTFLLICGFTDVESLSDVLQHLTVLEQLNIVRCPNLRDVQQTTSSLIVTIS